MAINLFRVIRNCSQLIKPHQLAGLSAGNKLFNAENTPHLQTRFHSSEPPKLGLRKLKLPPYPEIECINTLDVESFLPSRYKIVKHGDYDFLESADGYVQVYVQGFQHPKRIDARSGYAVFFGQNHPLNLSGPVERRQASNHAKIYAYVKALQQVPQDLFPNVCFCVDSISMLTFVNRSLRSMSENSFRSLNTGKLNKDLESSMELNRLLRTRQDLKIRMRYVPNDIGVDGMYHASRLARRASDEATQQFHRQRYEQSINAKN